MIGDNRVMDREIRGSQFILPSNNEIKNIIILMCWNFDVLGQIKCAFPNFTLSIHSIAHICYCLNSSLNSCIN